MLPLVYNNVASKEIAIREPNFYIEGLNDLTEKLLLNGKHRFNIDLDSIPALKEYLLYYHPALRNMNIILPTMPG